MRNDQRGRNGRGPAFYTCRYFEKTAMILDRRISLPRFHSHCFRALLWAPCLLGSFFVSGLCHLYTGLGPKAESLPPGQTRQRSHRSSASILDLVGPPQSSLVLSLRLFASSRRRLHRNSSQGLVDLLGDPDPVHQN